MPGGNHVLNFMQRLSPDPGMRRPGMGEPVTEELRRERAITIGIGEPAVLNCVPLTRQC
jgi:hypothetical protein